MDTYTYDWTVMRDWSEQQFDEATAVHNDYLTKWPQMIVTGERVTVTQAKEIIRRTDRFFRNYGWSNNKQYTDMVRAALGMPTDFGTPETFQIQNEWCRQWGYIDTMYVTNDGIASCYIGGAHGWCHPDGTIAFHDNVGKYPSVSEILRDWLEIAHAFPFLVADVTLMDGEHCVEGIQPVISMEIREGKVTVRPPIEGHKSTLPERDWTKDHPCYAIPNEWILEWATQRA
jgi:hypothetical protein